MRRGVANFFEKAQIAPDPEECEVVNVPVRFVPMGLSALETRKTRSFWFSDEDWYRGLQGINRMQWGLLMPCGEDIIREIREARGPLTADTGSGLEEWPVGEYPGYTLGSVAGRIGPAGTNLHGQLVTANQLLTQIRDAIQADSGDGEALLEQLQIIAALLAV